MSGFRWLWFLIVVSAGVHGVSAATIIDVGTIEVLPDLDGQPIELVAKPADMSQPDSVTGLKLRGRVGDGLGPLVEPTFSLSAAGGRGVDFTGGIWDANPTILVGGAVSQSPAFMQASIVFQAEATTVPAAGRIATIYVNTKGIMQGSFELRLSATPEIGVPTGFVVPGVGSSKESVPTIVNGTISVVPEPTMDVLATTAAWTCILLRRRRQSSPGRRAW